MTLMYVMQWMYVRMCACMHVRNAMYVCMYVMYVCHACMYVMHVMHAMYVMYVIHVM